MAEDKDKKNIRDEQIRDEVHLFLAPFKGGLVSWHKFELQYAADCFRARRVVVLLGNPCVKGSKLIGLKTHHNRGADPSSRTASKVFGISA